MVPPTVINTAKDSTFIPYIGPIVVNGILYKPVSEALLPKAPQPSSKVDRQQIESLPPIGPPKTLHTPKETIHPQATSAPNSPRSSQSSKVVDNPPRVELKPAVKSTSVSTPAPAIDSRQAVKPTPPSAPPPQAKSTASTRSFKEEPVSETVSSVPSHHSQSFVPLPAPVHTRDFSTQTNFPNPILPPKTAIMPGPQLGALGATFTVVRALQAVCLIAIIGMTSNFIDQMLDLKQKPLPVLLGTLSVTVITALYVGISYIMYWDSMLPFLVSTALDSLLLIAVIVVAVTVGKPLSYLDCVALSNEGGSTSSFIASVGENMSKVNYWVWAGASKTTCFELKSIWGLSIALCILFAFSSVVSACLWKKMKVVGPAKDIEN